ncbi:MAG: SDR family oxidoreductase [Parvularcula sp.]|jgi:NAD(P)-dependent dehydrogenase (short-subunit alcohol dehydrogenase family)|nr:SDR family oxidoreductase [Parvularcula sp.]
MSTVLITGANRGIGLALTQHYAGAGHRVHATCRNPSEAEDLNAVNGEVTVHELDTTDHEAIRRLAQSVDEPIDVLIANAGIYGPDRGGQSFAQVSAEALMRTMEVNLVGTLMTIQSFLPHVKKSAGKKVVAITSKMGSIADASGQAVAYRTSKTALNMAMCCAANELKAEGIAVGTLHPGWVRTDMGGPNGLIGTEESAAGLAKVIDGLQPADKAAFLDYKGETIPW